jgi:3-oxoacyl-[acyl-carrier-protein] synthase-3
MTAVREIAVHVPPSVPLASLADHLGLSTMDVRVFKRLHGLENVAMAGDLDWPGQLLAAAAGLTSLDEARHRIRYVIAARSEVPAARREPFPLDGVAARLGLRDDVMCFMLAEHACASALLAIDLAGRLLARDREPGGLALIFAGEKASDPRVQLIPDMTVMAEGSAALLVAADGERDRVLSYTSATPETAEASYEDGYSDRLAEVMTEAVTKAGLTWDDITLVLPHNVNRVSWVRTARLLDLPIERVHLDNVAAQAHSFSADSFINYVDARAAGRLRPDDAYVMAASGVHSVVSAMVFRH